MRNKNIFIRKETAQSCLFGGLPVFAHVLGYNEKEGNVVYEVDYLERTWGGDVHWHYASVKTYPDRMEYQQPARWCIYSKPLEDFLSLFSPDVFDEYGSVQV